MWCYVRFVGIRSGQCGRGVTPGKYGVMSGLWMSEVDSVAGVSHQVNVVLC